MKHFQIYPQFFPQAQQLRAEFDRQFADPRATDSKRFVWDYWYFENQYHLIRTPAFYYFTKKIYQNFHSHLVQWGRENLGCHDISPPWMSYYVDGCYQNLHSDVPHGPWAWVYSLTVNPKEFLGGETLILKPEILNYWSSFQDQHDREYNSFVDRLPSKFDQLIVFDPRFPHGVTEVKGTRDPQKARLVIHGWFVEPRPYVVGGLKTNQVQKPIGETLMQFSDSIKDFSPLNGTVSLRIDVHPSGYVLNYKEVTNTIVSTIGQKKDVDLVKKILKKMFLEMKFVKAKSGSKITIPILFK